MIISIDDFLLKVVVESTFSFVKYFFKKSFWTQWTMDMDNNKIQTTHSHKQQKKPIQNKNSRLTKSQKLTCNQ